MNVVHARIVTYEVWLWSSRNDFIVRLEGCHATWS